MVFSEDSRVKIPCILHLVRLGYRYLSLKDAVWDIDTNIFPALFNEAIARINPELSADVGVVTGRYGTLGEMYYVDGKYWPHNTALYVTTFKGNDPKYIYYLLSCLGRIRTSDKSAVPGVNRNELHEMGGFLKLWDRDILQDTGKVSAEIAKAHAESEFEKYRIAQDRLFESDFDRLVKQIESGGNPAIDEK